MSETITRFHPGGVDRNRVLRAGLYVFNILTNWSSSTLEAFVFGGQYAQGKTGDLDDVDCDFLWTGDPTNYAVFAQMAATNGFFQHNLLLHVEAHVGRNGVALALNRSYQFAEPKFKILSQKELEGLFQKHKNSPFIAKDEEVVEFWKLSV